MSVMGSGKTYVAAAVLSALGLPTLVVAPKISLTQWKRAAQHFGDSFSVVNYEQLRYGNTPFGTWQNGRPPERSEREIFTCQSCQTVLDPANLAPCYAHHLGIHCIQTKVKPHRYGRFTFNPQVKAICFDECHRCANDSLNADLLIAAARHGVVTLGLSATIGNSPLHFRALGYVLGLHGLTNYESWARKFGCGRIQGIKGFHWLAPQEDRAEIMLRIRGQIIPDRGIRLTERDIPNFPSCEILAELYDLPKDDTAELDKLQREVAVSLSALQQRQMDDVAPDMALTRILRARQRIELLKVPCASELGKDASEKGFSIVWFVNFRGTVSELLERHPDALVIDGSPESVKQRQANVDRFQSNQCRKLIVNNEVGGVSLSLQDLDGQHPRLGLVFPPQSAVTFRQLVGRLPRDGGLSPARYRVLFAANSCEVPMQKSLSGKLNNLDALNDGDLRAQNLSVCSPG